MSMRRGWVMLGAFLGLVGCQGAPSEEEQSGYLLLDREAREAGFELKGAPKDASRVLPIEVEPGADITLIGPEAKVALDVAADELLVVHGAEGKVESQALGEIDPDRLVVSGSEEAARELATVLAGELSPIGDGAWEIRAENALAEASRVRAPAGLVEVMPAMIGGSKLFLQAPAGMMAIGDIAGAEPVEKTERAAYDGRRLLILAESLMPPAVDCKDPIVGTWVSHQLHQGEWYIFTIKVHRAWAGSSKLVAEIHSEFWMGGPEDMAVPGCQDEAYHGAVTMAAEGFLSGDQVKIDGTKWQVAKTACVHEWSREYLLDHFQGTLEGSSFHATNNDGGRAIEEPTEFRRVKCQ